MRRSKRCNPFKRWPTCWSAGPCAVAQYLLRTTPRQTVEEDVLAINQSEGRLCELIEGVLVEKAMGFRESGLAGRLIAILNLFMDLHNLGVITGEAGTVRLMPGLVRIPDVAFTSWERLPNGQWPDEPMPNVSPDLAVES